MTERICLSEGLHEIGSIGEGSACKERTSDFKVHGRKRKCVRIQRELTEENSLTFLLSS